jgi:hypothetical protein
MVFIVPTSYAPARFRFPFTIFLLSGEAFPKLAEFWESSD